MVLLGITKCTTNLSLVLKFWTSSVSSNEGLFISWSMLKSNKDGSHHWGGFAHIESLVVYCLRAHFSEYLGPLLWKNAERYIYWTLACAMGIL